MAKSPTPTSQALLGLLSIRPWSTYELAKQVERSLGWFWPRTGRKVYDEAKKLVESGHATSVPDETGSRPRTVYTITAKGRRTLRAWLDERSPPPKLESETLVRVFFADAGDLDQLRATLADAGATARANLAELRALMAAAGDAEYPFPRRRHINAVSIRFQLDFQQMIADWADWALAQTDTWNDVDDPGTWDWQTALAPHGTTTGVTPSR